MADGILNPIEQLEAEIDFDVYTKQEVDALLDEKADADSVYTKTETDTLLSAKADADAVYTKTETDTLLSAKADKSTTLAGYGITDAYTQTQTDNLLNGKADADDVYTKAEINTKIPNTVGSATKPTYVNGGVVSACTYELNKTVPANAVFTDHTYTAGNGLNLSGASFSAKAGTNVTVNSSGINVNGNGAVVSADSGLINGGTAYTELRPTLDGTWVKNAQTTAINLQKLEGGIEYLYGLLSHQYDQLKKYINGNYYDYQTDTDSKYTKTVPNGAMPYASLDSVGGKTLVFNSLRGVSFRNGSINGVTFAYADGVESVSGTCDTATSYNIFNLVNVPIGHKVYVNFQLNATVELLAGTTFNMSSSSFANNSGVFTTTVSPLSCTVTLKLGEYNFSISPRLADLTLMFGSGNEPTAEEFETMFPNFANATQNAGQLLSAGVDNVVSVGRNLFDKSNVVSQSGYLTATGLPSGQIKFSQWAVTKSLSIEVKPNTQYTYSYRDVDGGRHVFGLFGSIPSYNDVGVLPTTTSTTVNGRTYLTFTTDSTTKYLVIYYYNTNDSIAESTILQYLMVATGNGTDDYAEYKTPIQYPIPASIQALEGYGWSAGTVFNYIDYERKVFVQNVARVDMGTLTWTKESNHFYSNAVSTAYTVSANTVIANILTNKYVTIRFTSSLYPSLINETDDKTIALNNSKRIYIYDTVYTDAPTLTTSLVGVYAYYELATPVEVDISAYLTDDNLIEVEAGGTLTFPNSNGTDYQIPIPSEETYMIDLQSAL